MKTGFIPWPRACAAVMLAAALSVTAAASAQMHDAQPAPALQSNPPAGESMQQEWALVQSGNYADAEKGLTAEVKSRPDNPDAWFLLGYVYYRELHPKKSLAAYTAGAQLRKPGANDLAVVAMDYILLRDYGDADKWLTMATKWDPGNALYWYYLGRTKNNEFQFKDAVAAFTQCLKLQPNDLRAEYNLGLAYVGLDRNDDAAQAYKTAIAWEAHAQKPDPQPYLDMGELLLQEQHAAEAVPYLQQAVALDGSNPTFHEQLGRAYEQTGRLKEAEAEMVTANRQAPNVPALHFELGRIYSREGLKAKAKTEFDRTAAMNAARTLDTATTPNPAPKN